MRKTYAIKIAGVIVFVLAVFTAFMIWFLNRKVTEEVDVVQYKEEFVDYLKAQLHYELSVSFENAMDERLMKQEPLFDEEVLTIYLNIIKEKEPAALCVREGAILEVGENDFRFIVDDDDKKEIISYQINQDKQDLCFWMSGLTKEECQPGTQLRFVAKENDIILVLGKISDEYVMERAWILANDNALHVKYMGHEFTMKKSDQLEASYKGYEDIADVTLKQGVVTDVKTYQNKIHGKLLSMKQTDVGYQIELDGIEPFPAMDSIQVYDLCDSDQEAFLQDLIVGYDFTDFVMDEKNVCVAALIARREKMQNIRVVLRTDGFEQLYHERVSITCDTEYNVVDGDMVKTMAAGEILEADAKSKWQSSRIRIIPKAYTGRVKILSLTRSQGTPSYRGSLEIEKTSEGFLLVNELPLDEYLYSVVPSEMPASYPQHALAAQSVSARTYAYSHMLHSNMQKYGAHVDDSTAFQVYNNMLEQEASTAACRLTAGEILYYGDKIATTYFYSTSCGYGTNMTAWTCDSEIKPSDQYLVATSISERQERPDALSMTEEEMFSDYIKSADTDAFESEDSYFRWKYESVLDEELFWKNINARYEANPQYVLTKTDEGYCSEPIQDQGHIMQLKVVKRAPGGAAIELEVTTENHTYKIMTEKNIRNIMANKETTILLGAEYNKEGTISTMIPSAFMSFETVCDEKDGYVKAYTVWGGGYGHGIGMSQNGAKAMAGNGYTYQQILSFFYRDTNLKNIDQ